jgi:hypothetical protein
MMRARDRTWPSETVESVILRWVGKKGRVG